MQLRINYDLVKYYLGWMLSIATPNRTAFVYNGFTISFDRTERGGNYLINSLIRFYLRKQACLEEKIKPGKLEAIHRNFWAKTTIYFDATKTRTQAVFIPVYEDFIEKMAPLLVENQIQTVCEFGTGDGKWLDHLSRKWVAVSCFIGIDISSCQIEVNKQKYPHLFFYPSDLVVWTEKNAGPHTLYHTNGGVLEYLSEASVRRLFAIIKTRAVGSLVLFNEPLYEDFDIKKDVASKILGSEYSYTHNYIHLLKEAGAQMLHHEERFVMGCRMLLVLAYFDFNR